MLAREIVVVDAEGVVQLVGDDLLPLECLCLCLFVCGVCCLYVVDVFIGYLCYQFVAYCSCHSSVGAAKDTLYEELIRLARD